MSTQIGGISGVVNLDVKPLERSAKRVKTETDKVTNSLFNAQKTANNSDLVIN